MPFWLSSLLAVLWAMFTKLGGYEFVVKVIVYLLEWWAGSTPNHLDDKIFDAAAKAWGIDSAVLKKLVDDANKEASQKSEF